VGYVLSLIQKKKLKIILAACMIVILIVMNKNFFVPQKYLRNVTDSSYTSPSVIRWHTSLLSFEYTPIGISTVLSKDGNSVINIKQNEVPTVGSQVIHGKMTVKQLQDIPQQKEFFVNAKQPGLLRLNTFTFPGWKTYIDGKEVAYSDTNKLRLITISISKGTHTIRATLTNTPTRTIANGISLVSIVGVIVYSLLRRKKILK
jgi:hypothetical protein